MSKASTFLKLIEGTPKALNAFEVINPLNEIVKDDKDRWRVSIDDHAKSFIVYKGSEDICSGYFDPETNRLYDIKFMDSIYQKNNQTKKKATDMIKKTFPKGWI